MACSALDRTTLETVGDILHVLRNGGAVRDEGRGGFLSAMVRLVAPAVTLAP